MQIFFSFLQPRRGKKRFSSSSKSLLNLFQGEVGQSLGKLEWWKVPAHGRGGGDGI